jgi:integrase
MPPRRYPTIKYSETDGMYHAWVTVGTKGNGRPDQRHVKRRTVAEVEARLDELLEQRRAGAVQKSGRAPTVAGWLLDVYLPIIAARKIDPTTAQGYRSKIENNVVPVIGGLRMDRVTADNIDAVYVAMQRKGLADATVLQVHRILARAWRVATKRRVVPRNIFRDDVDPPTAARKEMTPLTRDEAVRVLVAATGRRNSARWSIGLGIGPRQGEALGLRWTYLVMVCLDERCGDEVPLREWWKANLRACRRCGSTEVGAEARIWWQLHRRSFEHGCATPPTCGRRRGGNCPQRYLPLRSGEIVLTGGLLLKPPKGKGKRTTPLPPELVDGLHAHWEVQELERMLAAEAYVDLDLVYAGPLGEPIDPARDHDEWQAIITEAGVPAVRLHDGRHTAGTILLAQGVDIRVVQEILGHSSVKVTEGYTHVASKMAREATQRMGAALFRKPGTP